MYPVINKPSTGYVTRFLLPVIGLCAMAITGGCGVGLCVGAGATSGGCALSTPRLLLSGLDGLTLRKNDCYPVTLSAVDAAGKSMLEVNASISVTASSGVVLYSSLQSCQTYNSAEETSVFVLSPLSPQVVFFFRADVEGAVSLTASTSEATGLAAATEPLTVFYRGYDGSTGPNNPVETLVVDSSGSSFIGGRFISYDDSTQNYVARLNADGTLDTSFAPTGSGFNAEVYALSIQSDGKLLVGGYFLDYDGTSRPGVARLNADGSLDTSFIQTGSGLSAWPEALTTQSDGKVLAAGPFTSYNGATRGRVARLNVDGSIDTSFVPTGSGFNLDANALSLQSDGKVLVGGDFSSFDGTTRPHVARLNANGSLDTSFAQVGSGLAGEVNAIFLQSDGKVLVGGSFSSYDGTLARHVARLNADGSLDASFATVGLGLDNRVYAISAQSDGKVLVGGWFTSYHGTSCPRVARLNADGSLDTSFTPTGTGFNERVYTLSLLSDGKVLVGGEFTSYNGTSTPHLARLNVDGSLDDTFAPASAGLNNLVEALSLQSDGKAIVGGDFTEYSGTARPYVARLNLDGSLDTGFASTGSGLNNDVSALLLQSDGKVLVGGAFTLYNGTAAPRVVRLNADSSLDTSFAPTGSGLNNDVRALLLQGDGKCLVGGAFTLYNGTSEPRVARLNADGSVDNSFAPTGSGLNNTVSALSLQSNGKVLVGGQFALYDGTSAPRVARLNADGSLDTSFAPTGSGLNGSVNALSLQSDGKVLVGGAFSTYDGTSAPRVARLNSDGSLDTSFALTGSGLNLSVSALALQNDGKILIGGSFSTYDGTSTPRVARLNADGSLDTSFAPTSSGLNGSVNALSLQSDGKVLVGGSFTGYGPSTVRKIARLTYIGTLD